MVGRDPEGRKGCGAGMRRDEKSPHDVNGLEKELKKTSSEGELNGLELLLTSADGFDGQNISR